MVADYDRRRRLMVDGFRAVGLPTFEPRGAFYALPRTDGTGLDSEAFNELLLEEERVAVVPGSAFGAAGEGYVRACYASSYEFERALERIGGSCSATAKTPLPSLNDSVTETYPSFTSPVHC